MRALSPTRGWIITVSAMLMMAVSYLDRQVLASLAPTLSERFHLSESQYGLLQAAFWLAYLVSAPFAGAWIDRLGARTAVVIAVIVWSLASAAHGLATGFLAFFIARIALGVAEAPSFPSAAQTVQRILPPDKRALGFGILFTGSSLGGALAPILAVTFLQLWGWQAAFAGTALVGFLWIPLWWMATHPPEARKALGKAQQAIPAQDAGPLPFVPLARGVLSVLSFAPLFAFPLGWGAKYLVSTLGVPQIEIGRYLWLSPLIFDVGSITFGALASRADKRRQAAGLTEPKSHRLLYATAVGFGLTLGFLPWAQDPWTATAIFSLSMAGNGGLIALTSADLMARVPQGRVSRASGILVGTQSLGFILASPLIGATLQATQNYNFVVLGVLVWLIPGAAAWCLWPEPKQPPVVRPTTE